MLFQSSLTIPANTTEADPVVDIVRVKYGIINKIMVRPRPGHAGLAHLVIMHREHQIAPSTENMSFAGDTFPIDWDEFYELYQPPFELKLKGWNSDDTFPHTFDVYVSVMPRQGIVATAIADALRDLFSLNTIKRIFTGGT